jgi:excisionase family DNA binding protein
MYTIRLVTGENVYVLCGGRGAMIDHHEKFLTAREVADRLRIGLRTVWRWTKLGALPAPLRLGTRIVRWRAADIAEIISHPRTAERERHFIK